MALPSISIRRETRTLTRCLVCGFAEVRTDEVIDRGVVFLSECPQCRHRTTGRQAARLALRVAAPGEEAVTAA